MKLAQTFDVAAPLERVWSALIDVERVAPCLPGAAVTGRNDDGSYNGTFSVKIGPTSASYQGKLLMKAIDESDHTATMEAHGTDKRGQGGADATIVSQLTALDEDHTRVAVDTDYRITGRLARFGRGGMIEDISEKLLRQFADALAQSLTGPETVDDGAAAPTVDAAMSTAGDDAAGGQSRGESASAPSGGEPKPAELDGLGIVASVVKDRLKGKVLPLAGVLAVALLVLRRRGR